MSQPPAIVTPAAWDSLRRLTDARIALGRAGHSLPTAAHLAFQLAHAQARDAVHLPFDASGVAEGVQALGLSVLHLHSAASDRATYLQRPDLGRRLDERSLQTLQQWRDDHSAAGAVEDMDIAFVVCDGLSARAVHAHAPALLDTTLAHLHADSHSDWRVGPVAIVEQGRVAVGDAVGAGLRVRCVVVLIGERPGLSSPDSVGVYLTWAPMPGLTDASRNCISNVRTAGLSVEAASAKLFYLLQAARRLRASGVGLKDEMGDPASELPDRASSSNFLLGE